MHSETTKKEDETTKRREDKTKKQSKNVQHKDGQSKHEHQHQPQQGPNNDIDEIPVSTTMHSYLYVEREMSAWRLLIFCHYQAGVIQSN